MTNYGMNFAPQGGNAINAPTYSSLQERLQIDLNNPAPLFDVVTVGAGSAFSVSQSTVQSDSEQLLVINHNLGYIPQVYVTFLLTPNSGSSSGANSVDTYSLGQMTITNNGYVADYIGFQLTTTTMAVVHTVASSGEGTGSYTSPANEYNVQIKYLICNNLGIQTLSFN